MAKASRSKDDLQVEFDLTGSDSTPVKGAGKTAAAPGAKRERKRIRAKSDSSFAPPQMSSKGGKSTTPDKKRKTAASPVAAAGKTEKSQSAKGKATKSPQPASIPTKPGKSRPVKTAKKPAGIKPEEKSASVPVREQKAKSPPSRKPAAQDSSSDQAPPQQPEPAAGNGTDPNRILKLVNTKDGCWKILPDGKRIALSEEEWRAELTSQFKQGEFSSGG